jgi:O-antigen/teichoic acid export membrane protein
MLKTIVSSTITRNALWLALRMAAVLVAGLLASRAVLSALGVVDYGVYALVASVVAGLSFVQTAAEGASSRFLAYEMGRGDAPATRRVFGAALTLHLGVAAVVAAALLTAGRWFLLERLSLPPGMERVALTVLWLTVASTAVTMAATPFTSLVMAHERMKVYAWIEMATAALKLTAAAALWLVADGSRLETYAWMLAGVSVAAAAAYVAVGRELFAESRCRPVADKRLLRPMLAFTALDLYGNLCATLRVRGLEWLVNLSFGVVMNASLAIVSVATNALLGLSSAVIAAFRPRVIKSYAAADRRSARLLTAACLGCALAVYAVIALPLAVWAPEALAAWLGDVPRLAPLLLRLLLVQGAASLTASALSLPIHASGRLKWLSLGNGTLYLVGLGCVAAAYAAGAAIGWGLAISAAVMAVGAVNCALIAGRVTSPARGVNH